MIKITCKSFTKKKTNNQNKCCTCLSFKHLVWQKILSIAEILWNVPNYAYKMHGLYAWAFSIRTQNLSLQLLLYSQPSPVAAIVKIQYMFCNLSEWTWFTNRQKRNKIKQEQKWSSVSNSVFYHSRSKMITEILYSITLF